ncbi:MAG: FHA domain-containing protein [Bdellovibrionales bacterium]|nr:FHA domain-containing protein [Bdellovibrionales bacterium]
MAQEIVFRFKSSQVPLQEGEYARLRVLQGPDLGTVYVIKSSSLTLGRGDGVSLRIADLKASRVHARIEFTSSVGWRVVDLGSANGIFYSGEFVRDFALKSGDHFTVGETIFEFLMNSESGQVLMAPILDDPELEKREVAFAEQKIRVRALGKEIRFAAKKNAKKTSPLVLVLGALFALAYVYPEEAGPILYDYGLDFIAELIGAPPKGRVVQQKKNDPKKDEKDRSLASYGAPSVAPEVARTAEQYFRQGFREFKAGNYLRAREIFSLALQVNPGHERARDYLENSIRENEREVKRLIDLGRRARDVGRFKLARSYFSTALRHSGDDPEDPMVIESTEALKELDSTGGNR